MGTNPERLALTEAVYYILLSLTEPLHGYGMMQRVREMSRGRLELGAGTLYGALSALTEKGWIEPVSGEEDSRRKAYRITEAGRRVLAAEIGRLTELLENGREVLGADHREEA